jgi:hypothetical protein
MARTLLTTAPRSIVHKAHLRLIPERESAPSKIDLATDVAGGPRAHLEAMNTTPTAEEIS